MRLFRRPPTLSVEQRDALSAVLGPLDRYRGGDHDVLADLTAWLLARPDWSAARGFDLTEDMRFAVAATAAVLGVGIAEDDPFGNVSGIVVHPSTMVDRRPRATPMRGVVTEAPRSMLGHTTAHGPVFVSWQAVERDRHHGRGSVVLHEFAHKLDAATTMMDGTPRLDGVGARPRWVEVCTRVYEQLRAGGPDPVLRRYGATNPTEFFAVATEAFFTRPLDLRHVHPDLFGVFADAFHQDPATVDAGRGLTSRIADDERAAAERAAAARAAAEQGPANDAAEHGDAAHRG